MKTEAQIVIIGGGITGCSIAYHLAKAGWTDVLLLEKGELTSGATFHSVGLVSQFRASPAQMLLMNYSIQLYDQFESEVGDALGWRPAGTGSIGKTWFLPQLIEKIPHFADKEYTAERTREVYKQYYHLHYPLDENEWGRPKRLSALHPRLQALGAVVGEKNGWERANYFKPGQPGRRAEAEQHNWGWDHPPYFDRVGEEHRAVRERVGLLDMSSFGKIEVTGPGALGLLQRLACNNVDKPVGSLNLHPVPERPRRHRKRRHHRPPGRGALPGDHRDRVRGQRPGLDRHAHA